MMAPGGREREDIFLEVGLGLCPECRRLVHADVLVRGRRVYLRKWCPEHGHSEALASSDIDHYRYSLKYNKPGTLPRRFHSRVEQGCPQDCGLCPDHQQHTCLAIIDVTQACDLKCPACLADAGGSGFLTVEQVGRMLDVYRESEGNPDVLQFSGGEPALHPQLFELLAMARDKGIRLVQLNTNGLRIARDDAFLARLAEFGPSVYLQFDGLSADVYRRIRGADLLADKLRAVERLSARGIPIVLSATVVRGVNDGELGGLMRFALQNVRIRGLMFQPVAQVGRHRLEFDPLDRVTLPDILDGLERQTGGELTRADFVPVPCPYPTCFALTYVYTGGERLTTAPRLVNVDDYLDYFKNRIITDLSPLTQTSLEGLWSAGAVPGTDESLKSLASCCGISLEDLEGLRDRITMIGVHAFMDIHNFELKRARKCCVHQLLPDGGLVPFCVYNVLKRGG
ncbi:MAG: radical SAM protein [Bacillota bacterium]|jgi:uncharacterized radical SAM superfamily Fe-S cluster-containing enzyme